MGRNSRKSDILDAASKIVNEQGIFNLTLDAVAKEAGLSKGGLLYHYPSKEELVKGMVAYLANNYQEKIAKDMEGDPEDKGKWLRAYVNVTFNQSEQNKQKNAVLLAAKAVDFQLLDPIRDLYKSWEKELENDGVDPMKAAIIQLAADGVWLSELFDINRMEDKKKEEVFQYLMDWAKE
ncbi:TetR/AcrR family transcriptional regulator [Oceanobacillus salinisoli]|uniref:TetR/AcrR family transcriptional regulator n=1 Tax=Oceanobacillus salinisoli TaxID=2678611 RepID=UPI0012E15489|nr:TetR/AcrR family transcriptional regulator [Oceanobacillus salinisoli]